MGVYRFFRVAFFFLRQNWRLEPEAYLQDLKRLHLVCFLIFTQWDFLRVEDIFYL